MQCRSDTKESQVECIVQYWCWICQHWLIFSHILLNFFWFISRVLLVSRNTSSEFYKIIASNSDSLATKSCYRKIYIVFTGWLKSFCSHQERALLTPHCFPQVGTFVMRAHAKLHVLLSTTMILNWNKNVYSGLKLVVQL